MRLKPGGVNYTSRLVLVYACGKAMWLQQSHASASQASRLFPDDVNYMKCERIALWMQSPGHSVALECHSRVSKVALEEKSSDLPHTSEMLPGRAVAVLHSKWLAERYTSQAADQANQQANPCRHGGLGYSPCMAVKHAATQFAALAFSACHAS